MRPRPAGHRSFAQARPATAPAEATGRGPIVAAALAFGLCFAYAVVRYVVLKGEPLSSMPLYVTNKAVALFAMLLIAAAAPRPLAPWRRAARAAGFLAAALHGLASVVLLRPAYLAKLHGPGGRLTGSAELAVICGAVALVAFAALRRSLAPLAASRVARGALALAAVHCAALGAHGWLEPGRWNGGLPPLTLLGALAATGGLVAALLGRRRAVPAGAFGAEPRALHPGR
jgi:hypothetical protein